MLLLVKYSVGVCPPSVFVYVSGEYASSYGRGLTTCLIKPHPLPSNKARYDPE